MVGIHFIFHFILIFGKNAESVFGAQKDYSRYRVRVWVSNGERVDGNMYVHSHTELSGLISVSPANLARTTHTPPTHGYYSLMISWHFWWWLFLLNQNQNGRGSNWKEVILNKSKITEWSVWNDLQIEWRHMVCGWWVISCDGGGLMYSTFQLDANGFWIKRDKIIFFCSFTSKLSSVFNFIFLSMSPPHIFSLPVSFAFGPECTDHLLAQLPADIIRGDRCCHLHTQVLSCCFCKWDGQTLCVVLEFIPLPINPHSFLRYWCCPCFIPRHDFSSHIFPICMAQCERLHWLPL